MSKHETRQMLQDALMKGRSICHTRPSLYGRVRHVGAFWRLDGSS